MKLASKQIPNLALLPEIFKPFAAIRAVYLFGSMASGNARKDSDCDLAVLTNISENSELKIQILSALAANGFCKVDLVILNHADPVLRFEAIRQNRLIYRQPSFNYGSYFSNVIRKYFDILPGLDVQRAVYKQRLLNG